jgi:ferredoxin-NADP reductase
MKKIIHPVAGGLATLIIILNWASTAFSELFGSEAVIIAVKTAIPWGFILLIPAMAATGASGFALSKGARGGLVGAKMKRMPIIAINGLVVLVPAALYLAAKARAGELDGMFYFVQIIELIAGAINLSLMSLNMRDGLRLAGKLGTNGQAGGEISLIGSETIADGTTAFRFSKPAGMRFEAGQWAKITLINPSETDRSGNSRTFTIASAPDDDSLMFATRMRDTAFKRSLKAMAPGTKVRISAPGGDLVLPADTSRPLVFLAGGIGITPFRAMIRQATKCGLPYDLQLIYSNRSPADAAFLAELQQTATESPRFQLIATMTDANVKDWEGESGMIDDAMLSRQVTGTDKPIWYLAGPTKMVASMRDLLLNKGVAVEDIRSEEFYGY